MLKRERKKEGKKERKKESKKYKQKERKKERTLPSTASQDFRFCYIVFPTFKLKMENFLEILT